MKAHWAAKILLVMTLLLAQACGREPPAGKGDSGRPQRQLTTPSNGAGPARWQARYEVQCPDGTPSASCTGAYGFEVASNGYYRVGPGPDGEEFGGVLGDDDFRQVTLALRDSDAYPDGLVQCGTLGKDQDRSETIQLFNDGHPELFCNPNLLTRMRDLVSRYYPSPFPNPCIDANMDLERFYEKILPCENDSDCTYLDEGFLPLNPSDTDLQPIPWDDCSFISPLVVANSFKVVELQRELVMKRSAAEQVCGEESRKPFCSKMRSLDPRAGAPVCAGGRCQANVKQFKIQ